VPNKVGITDQGRARILDGIAGVIEEADTAVRFAHETLFCNTVVVAAQRRRTPLKHLRAFFPRAAPSLREHNIFPVQAFATILTKLNLTPQSDDPAVGVFLHPGSRVRLPTRQ
jgi:hypothetical protein